MFREIIRREYRGIKYTVQKTETKYICDFVGVTYRPNGGWPSWGYQVYRKDLGLNINTSYSIKKYGFFGALEKSIDDGLEIRERYDLDSIIRTVDKKKIMAYELPVAGCMNRRKRKTPKNKVKISQDFINQAKEEYFKNGGSVKKIEIIEPMRSYDDYSADHFLTGV